MSAGAGNHDFTLSGNAWPQSRFAREMTDGLPLEHSEPIRPLWPRIANIAGFIAFLITVVLVTSWAR